MRVVVAGVLGAVASLSPSNPARAAIYDVGPARTYKTPAAVANLLNPGDEVRIDGDATYPSVLFGRAGSAAQKIKIIGLRVNNKRPVISGGNNAIEAAGDHYEFSGLEITAGVSRCFYHHADDIVLRDSFIHDCPKQGLLGADNDSGSLLLEYTEVSRSGEGDRNHQIYMATDETTHPGAVFRMQYCWVHDGVGGNNVKSRAERNEIYYNWIEGAFYHELELIGPDPAGGAGTMAREDSDVVGNVFVKTRPTYVVRFGGDGTGASSGRYRFVNNTVIVQPAASAVFRLFDPLQSVEMHNNVFDVAGAGGVNLVRTVEAVWTDGIQIAGSNNWIKTGSTNAPAQWTGTLMGADPGFVNQGAFMLRPTDASPLRNAGAGATAGPPGFAFPTPLPRPDFHPPEHTVGAPGGAERRPVAGSIDIGAFENGPLVGGAMGTGGATGTGGAGGGSGSGGSGGGGVSNGGSGTAGSTATAGGSGGQSATGGTVGTGAGGAAGAGGSAGVTGTGGDGGGGSGADTGAGCGCRIAGAQPAGSLWPSGFAALAVLFRNRRKKR